MKTWLKQFWIMSWIGLIVGCLPISLFLIGWWGSIGRVPENKIFIIALSGLLIGAILAVFFTKAILRNLFSIPLLLLGFIYVFYFICFYGFFMGFPVFNVILSIPAGSYMGSRMKISTSALKRKYLQTSLIFTLLCLLGGCIVSAWLALREKTIGSEIQHMFCLPFPINTLMVWCLIIIGTLLLLILHYFLFSVYYHRSLKTE